MKWKTDLRWSEPTARLFTVPGSLILHTTPLDNSIFRTTIFFFADLFFLFIFPSRNNVTWDITSLCAIASCYKEESLLDHPQDVPAHARRSEWLNLSLHVFF